MNVTSEKEEYTTRNVPAKRPWEGDFRKLRFPSFASSRKMEQLCDQPGPFESHLKMFELGMPPHGGLAIGLERLSAQVLGLGNIREATLYPRDRYRVTP